MIKEGIAVEYAKPNNVESIEEFEKNWKKEKIDCDMNPYSRKEIEDAILEERIILAKYQSKIIGYVYFDIDKDVCELDAIYVDKNFRGKGVGQLLMEYFLRIKKVVSCKKIYLLADSIHEEKLIAFYKRYGFKKVAVRMLRVNV